MTEPFTPIEVVDRVKGVERVKTTAIERWSLSRERLDKVVSQAKESLQYYLGGFGLDSHAVQQAADRYEDNSKLFKKHVYGPAHDERHMAGVTQNAIDIFDQHSQEISEPKRKLAGIVIGISAVDHDRGDIPLKGEALVKSQRREERSVADVVQFITHFEGIADKDKDEASALAGLLVASTAPHLDMDMDAGSLDDLEITKVVRHVWTQGEQDAPFSDKTREQGLSVTIAQSVATLKDKGWKLDEVLALIHMMDAADYSAYLGEISMVEQLGLWVEKNEIYEDNDGKLIGGTIAESTSQWIKPVFRKKVYSLYERYLTDQTKGVYQDSLATWDAIDQRQRQPKANAVIRFESSLTPADALYTANESKLLEPGKSASKAVDARTITGNLIDFSRGFVGHIKRPENKWTTFYMATMVARDLHFAARNRLVGTEGSHQGEVTRNMLTKINTYLQEESTEAVLHIAPRAYLTDDWAVDPNSPEIFGLANSAWNELSTDWGRKKDRLFSNISSVCATFRMDEDSSPTGVKQFLNFLNNKDASRLSVSIGGYVDNEDARVGADGKSKYERVYDSVRAGFDGHIMIHAGFFEGKGDDWQRNMDAVWRVCENEIQQAGDARPKISLHLDRSPVALNRWIDRMKQSDPDFEAKLAKIDVLCAPLPEIMVQGDYAAKAWVDVMAKIPHIQLSGNNLRTMAAGATPSMQDVAMDQIQAHYRQLQN